MKRYGENFHAQLLEQEFSNRKEPLVREVILLVVKHSHLHRSMTLINNDQAGMYSTKNTSNSYRQMPSPRKKLQTVTVIGKKLEDRDWAAVLNYSTMLIYNNTYLTALKSNKYGMSGLSLMKPYFGSCTKKAPAVPQLKGATRTATCLLLLN